MSSLSLPIRIQQERLILPCGNPGGVPAFGSYGRRAVSFGLGATSMQPFMPPPLG